MYHLCWFDTKSKLLAWDDNIVNEYRMSTTFIQMVIFIHNECEEKSGGAKTKIILAFQK